ncbi:MAG: glutaredoxin family protein [Spirochaeta sp.]
MNTPTEAITVEGERTDKDLVVYALSTCAFCKRSMEFLSELGFTYSYVYLDDLELEKKRAIKAELKSQFRKLPVFPILVINGSEALSGFIEDRWRSALGVEEQV